MSELIVMLTKDDLTVSNAKEIFDKCKDSKAKYWGFKEEPLPIDQMKELFSYMKKCGKTTFLEVVAYTKEECLEGAKKAAQCNCDILMGTIYSDEVNDYCKKHNLKYMPFVGNIQGRPSILYGEISDMVKEAKSYVDKGVYGIDLLGYRYIGDANILNEELVKNINAPVCLAGSINSFARLDEVKQVKPWAFTIGSAFFENKFGDDIKAQINSVCDYINT